MPRCGHWARLKRGVGRPGRGRQNPEDTPEAGRRCSTWEGVSPRVGAPPDAGRRSASACRLSAARRPYPHDKVRPRAGRATWPGQRFPQARVHRGRSAVPVWRPRATDAGWRRHARPGRRAGVQRGWRPHAANAESITHASGLAPPRRPAPGRGRTRAPPTRVARRSRAWRSEAGGAVAHPRRRRAPHGPEARRAGPARRWAPTAWGRGPAGGGRGGQRGGASQRSSVPEPAPNKGLLRNRPLVSLGGSDRPRAWAVASDAQ